MNLILNAQDADVPNPLMDVPEKLPGYTHLALVCGDVDVAEAVLLAAGHPLSGRMDLPFGMRAIFVRDPDRNVVELDQFPAGMTLQDVHMRLEAGTSTRRSEAGRPRAPVDHHTRARHGHSREVRTSEPPDADDAHAVQGIRVHPRLTSPVQPR